MNFKVGDKIKIKSWDEMEKEFGLDSDGDINCNEGFIKDMAYLCGKEATIKKINLNNWLKLDIDVDDWVITTDMVKKCDVEKTLGYDDIYKRVEKLISQDDQQYILDSIAELISKANKYDALIEQKEKSLK